jgi:murein DD-endopeptidase MepM/ murein hydrolase activator NlpD
MMEDLRDMAAEVMVAKDGLAAEKAKIELKKAELVESEALLEEKRAESDRLLSELNSDKERLIEECEKYEAEEALLHDEIAKLEAERTEALRKEWEEAERKRREEEEKKKQEEANKQNQNNNNNGNSGSSNNDSNPPASNEKFFFPLEYCAKLTSPYGYRVHPVTGKYHLHNGVDLAAAKGTKIYATKSGKVTTAVYNYSWGYYVVINHLDGFSSLYGHMTNFVVSEGQYVKRGQLIGYVGSTGWSTGNHLHFTVYYNGATVNPMNYISMP